jgi:HKD family nuclease
MEIKIVRADDGSLVDQVKASLQWCHTAYIGVAYAKYNAFELLKPHFEQFLRRNGKLRLIFDIERFITDREIIEEFATIAGDSECKVFIKSKPFQKANPHLNYHPKSYLFFDDDNYHVIIGSSNLSLGGLTHNIECNLSVRGPKEDVLFEEVSSYFLNTWNMEYMVNVLTHGELLNEYRVLFKESEKEDRRKAKRISQLRGSLDKKVDAIIKSQKKILNENFSYLLGLISVNSTFDRAKKILEME